MLKHVLAGALGAACLLPAAAEAQSPTPDPCPAKVTAADPAGDARFYGAIPAPASLDVVEGSLRTADRKTTVTFKVTDLTKEVPAYTTGVSWYFEYTLGGVALFVDATLAPDGTVTYGTGTDGQSYTPTGTTKGTFDVENDTVSIVIPGISSSTASVALTTTRFVTYGAVGAATPLGSAALLPSVDSAAGDDYVAKPCSTTPPPAV